MIFGESVRQENHARTVKAKQAGQESYSNFSVSLWVKPHSDLEARQQIKVFFKIVQKSFP